MSVLDVLESQLRARTTYSAQENKHTQTQTRAFYLGVKDTRQSGGGAVNVPKWNFVLGFSASTCIFVPFPIALLDRGPVDS